MSDNQILPPPPDEPVPDPQIPPAPAVPGEDPYLPYNPTVPPPPAVDPTAPTELPPAPEVDPEVVTATGEAAEGGGVLEDLAIGLGELLDE